MLAINVLRYIRQSKITGVRARDDGGVAAKTQASAFLLRRSVRRSPDGQTTRTSAGDRLDAGQNALASRRRHQDIIRLSRPRSCRCAFHRNAGISSTVLFLKTPLALKRDAAPCRCIPDYDGYGEWIIHCVNIDAEADLRAV
jgi:hypothetical protein